MQNIIHSGFQNTMKLNFLKSWPEFDPTLTQTRPKQVSTGLIFHSDLQYFLLRFWYSVSLFGIHSKTRFFSLFKKISWRKIFFLWIDNCRNQKNDFYRNHFLGSQHQNDSETKCYFLTWLSPDTSFWNIFRSLTSLTPIQTVLTFSEWDLGEVNCLGFIPYIFKSHWIGIRSKLLKI